MIQYQLFTDIHGVHVYRYIGRKDHSQNDSQVSAEAALWLMKWQSYRYSTCFWLALSRLPVIRNFIGINDDAAKVRADRGFVSSTAIAWAYECAGVDLVPNRSPDVTSVDDLARCALLKRITE